MLNFNPNNENKTSFLYEESAFEVKYFTILSQLSMSNFDKNLTYFPNPKIILNKAQMNKLSNFYSKSLTRYNLYVQPNGVAETVQKLSNQMILKEDEKLTWIYIFIIILAVAGTVGCAIIFVDYVRKLYLFTSALFEFPEQTINRLKI